jgi:acyl-CoA thioesterase-1
MRLISRYRRAIVFVNRAFLVATITLSLAPALASAATTHILAFGDSLTAGYGLPPNEGFTARLAAKLKAAGYDVAVANGGVSGDTTAGGRSRLDWSMNDHPDVVLLELGANDMLRGIDPKLTAANLDAILAKITAAKAKVLLIGMLAPSNWGTDYQKSFNEIYPALAKKYDIPLYPFFLDGVAMDASLNQGDMLHPNAAGVDKIVARIAPAVEKLLTKPAS